MNTINFINALKEGIKQDSKERKIIEIVKKRLKKRYGDRIIVKANNEGGMFISSNETGEVVYINCKEKELNKLIRKIYRNFDMSHQKEKR